MIKNLIFFGHLKGHYTDESFDLHLRMLDTYSDIFDRQIIYLSFDEPENVDTEWCRNLFSFFKDPLIKIVKNNPTSRESLYFIEQLNSLDNEESITFYCHSKGITGNGEREWLEHWIFSMYHFNLHDRYLPTVEMELTSGKVFAGTLRKNVPCSPWVNSPWHYSGTFCWFNTLKVLKRKSDDYRIDRMSTESFPGEIATIGESYCTPNLDLSYNFDARYKDFWTSLFFDRFDSSMRNLYDQEHAKATRGKIINYEPIIRDSPRLMTSMPSAWGDIPTIIKDIIQRFNLKTGRAIEFGVEFGYSTSAISNYFDEVIGIDTFLGDPHAGIREDHYEMTKSNLSDFPNIRLVQSTYQDYIAKNDDHQFFDFAHIDIIHTYDHTFECGEWAVTRSKVTVFHDTELFDDVKRACYDLAKKYNLEFYNYPFSHGLGILHNPAL